MKSFSPRPEVVEIAIAQAATVYESSRDEILGPSHHGPVVTARREVALRLYEAGFTCTQIGRWLERRHSSIMRLIGPSGKRPPRAQRPANTHQRGEYMTVSQYAVARVAAQLRTQQEQTDTKLAAICEATTADFERHEAENPLPPK